MDMIAKLLEADPDLSQLADLELTCVISTQRSGSTMLARDLSSMTVFGTVDEHFTWLMNQIQANGRVPELQEVLKAGFVAPDKFGLKIMVNQFAYFGAYIHAPASVEDMRKKDENIHKILSGYFFSSFFKKFRKSNLIFLSRQELFAQSLSRLQARATGLYHDQTNGNRIELKPDSTVPSGGLSFALAINKEIQLIAEEEAEARKMFQQTGANVFELSYQKVAKNYPDYLYEILDHFGIERSRAAQPARITKKVINDQTLRSAQARYLEAIGVKTNPAE